MDFVRGDTCGCVGDRTTRPVVYNLSIKHDFQKLGGYDRRTRTCRTVKSDLAALVWGFPVDHTIFDLDERQAIRREGTARPTSLCAFDRHLLFDDLAGALGVFFCVDVCARASGVPRAH